MSAAAQPLAGAGRRRDTAAELARWWPLAALTLLAAVLRLSTLGLQSFWYDEAFTVVRDLHPGLVSTLHSVVHTENNPPLWYLIAWADSRVLGTGAVALRLPSALCGIALVPVAWGIGAELGGRRPATLMAALVAVNPLYVWYSQEARPYGLYVFTAGLAILCFVRADRVPTRGRMALFALTAVVAMLSHYFAVFLVAGMLVWLVRAPGPRRRLGLLAGGVVVLAGLALLPLVIAQGGHGTQWIGRWALSSRLQAIPQYYLTGYTGSALGHGVELLVALPVLAGLVIGGRALAGASGEEAAREREGLAAMLVLAGAGILIPVVLALLGADYLAPRNLLGAMVPVTAVIALLVGAPRTGRAGVYAGVLIALASLAITIDVNLSPRLQRGDWRALAHAIGPPSRTRAVTTVQLGETPLQYYLAGLRNLRPGTKVLVDEIDETGYAPLRPDADRPPARGFVLSSRQDHNGLILLRFTSPTPRLVSEAALRRHVITREHPEVLVPDNARLSA